jgi:hypothetical protein
MATGITRASVLALTLAIFAPADAFAQFNPLKAARLEPEAVAAMGEAAAKLYTNRETPKGTTEAWQAPTGSSGTVRLADIYDFDGMPCARLQHQVKRASQGDPLAFTIDRCQTPDGEWKIK